MSRMRLMLVSILAVLALSAVASASASAACTNTGSIWTMCDGGVIATEGNHPFHATWSGTEQSLLEVAAITLHIVCTLGEALGTLDQEKATLELLLNLDILLTVLKFDTCEVLEHPNCLVTEPIEVKPAEGEVEGEDTAAAVTIKPQSGTEFVNIVIKNKSETEKCGALAGSYKVTGSQKCLLPELSVEKVEHSFECKHTGSTLKVGGNEGTFELKPIAVALEGADLGLAFSGFLG